MHGRLANLLLIQRVLFLVVAMLICTGLVWAGKEFYEIPNQSGNPFFTKLGDLTLQLAIVVIVGAFVKELIDWSNAQLRRYRDRLESRMDFLKRVRAAHVEVEFARDLLNAHRSGKTYVERMQRLIILRAEIAEIIEDLKASPELFSSQDGIVDGLEGIVSYLKDGRSEYIKHHDDVDADAKANKKLDLTVEKQRMCWVESLMLAGQDFQDRYEANLDGSKGVMRRQVYGS